MGFVNWRDLRHRRCLAWVETRALLAGVRMATLVRLFGLTGLILSVPGVLLGFASFASVLGLNWTSLVEDYRKLAEAEQEEQRLHQQLDMVRQVAERKQAATERLVRGLISFAAAVHEFEQANSILREVGLDPANYVPLRTQEDPPYVLRWVESYLRSHPEIRTPALLERLTREAREWRNLQSVKLRGESR